MTRRTAIILMIIVVLIIMPVPIISIVIFRKSVFMMKIELLSLNTNFKNLEILENLSIN